MDVRRATKDDWEEFSEMWTEMLEEALITGGDVLPTTRTMKTIKRYFDCYDTGVLRGVAITSEGAGVLMWGEAAADIPFDTINDPYAIGWGTYVRNGYRGEGISSRMRNMARNFLLESGFSSLVGSVSPGNLAGNASVDSLGFKRTQVQVTWNLKEWGAT